MTTKDDLHQLVDELPESAVAEVAQILERWRAGYDAGLPAVLRDAPWDDEPETDEEHALVQEAYEAVARGEVVPDEELDRELGW